MSRRHNHLALAFIVLSAVACSDDNNSCDTNALSADADADVSADAGAKNSAAGRSGGDDGADSSRDGGGVAPAGDAGGTGGKGGASAAPKDGDDADEEDDSDKEGQKDNQGGSGGSSTEGAGEAADNPMAGAGAADTSSDEDAGVPEQGPHLKTATLQGHMWLAYSGAGTTLTATGFDTAVVSEPVCIQGSVAATPDYNSNAALGLNLNQPPNGVPMPFTPTLAGLQLDVTNRAGSPLRVLIQAQDGTGLWCANVNGSGGFIAWTDFNTACWDGSGTAYANQPLAVASVQVPGGIDAAIPYDFCLNTLSEIAAPAAAQF